MENIGRLLKHPLVIVVAVLLAALVFYNIASPYKNCIRSNTNSFAYTSKVTGRLSIQACMKKCLEKERKPALCDLLIRSEMMGGNNNGCEERVRVKRPVAEAEKRVASYCSRKGHSW